MARNTTPHRAGRYHTQAEYPMGPQIQNRTAAPAEASGKSFAYHTNNVSPNRPHFSLGPPRQLRPTLSRKIPTRPQKPSHQSALSNPNPAVPPPFSPFPRTPFRSGPSAHKDGGVRTKSATEQTTHNLNKRSMTQEPYASRLAGRRRSCAR